MERTKEMWTPRERWTPEQSRQNTVPNDTDALILICKTVNEYMNYYFVIWMQKHLCLVHSPLRIFHAAVAAFVIACYGFDHCLVTGGHLHHFDWCFIT